MNVVSITGKRGRSVPLLLKPDVKRSMDLIVDKNRRAAVGISPTNVYVFARACVTSVQPFRGYDSVKKCAVDAECQNPGLITSRMSHKYISTVSQVMAT